MAKRKLKGKPREQAVYQSAKKRKSSQSRTFAYIIIGIAFIALIGLAARSMPASEQSSTATTVSAELAPPMTGIQTLTPEKIDAKTAKMVTFKLDELAGTDCVQSFLDNVQNGGVGNIRADYDRRLLEVQYDPTKQTVTKLLDALLKSNHPSKVTSDQIAKSTTSTSLPSTTSSTTKTK